VLAIEMLPAGHGDALVVEYGTRAETHRLLIDAGTVHSWDGVRQRLLDMPDKRYEAFVITHVDEDHIGGAVRLLGDRDLRHRINDVWFNGFIHCKRGGNVLGPVDGERLTRAIRDGDYRWNDPFPRRISSAVGGPVVVPSKGALPAFDLPGGAVLHLLSPTGPKLKRMANVWETVVTDAGLVAGAGADRPGNPPKPYHKPTRALPASLSRQQLTSLAAPTDADGSAANGSSIAFLLEFGGKRILLGADAHPKPLVEALRRFAATTGEARVRIDLCKLPHHGSAANVTTELIEAIDTSDYLVSTNGDTFGHPNDEALARIICSSARPVTIHCNYSTERTIPWIERAAAIGSTVNVPREGAVGIRVAAR
jgi:hypothetical protein